jgi:hypothetical protein
MEYFQINELIDFYLNMPFYRIPIETISRAIDALHLQSHFGISLKPEHFSFFLLGELLEIMRREFYGS